MKKSFVALLALSLAATCAPGFAADEEDNPSREKRKIVALEDSFEIERLNLQVGDDGTGLVNVSPEAGCAQNCQSRTLRVTAASKLLYQNKPQALRNLRSFNGRPGIVYVKIGTDQVNRISIY